MLNPDDVTTQEIAAMLRELSSDADLMADSADNLQREFDAARAGILEEPDKREWFEQHLVQYEQIRHDCAVLVNVMARLRQAYIDRLGGVQHYKLPRERWWEESTMRPHLGAAKTQGEYPFVDLHIMAMEDAIRRDRNHDTLRDHFMGKRLEMLLRLGDQVANIRDDDGLRQLVKQVSEAQADDYIRCYKRES